MLFIYLESVSYLFLDNPPLLPPPAPPPSTWLRVNIISGEGSLPPRLRFIWWRL